MSTTGRASGHPGGFTPGRLTGFEDGADGADDVPDLASLLTRRAVPPAAPPDGPPDAVDRTPAVTPPKVAQSAQPPPATAARISKRAKPARTPPAPAAPTEPHPAPTPAPSARSGRTPIRSTSVHVPVGLREKINAERARTGRSNGEIVIRAIELNLDQLSALFSEHGRGASAGRLFQQRVSRGARLSDGPLSPINVRLFEPDFEVLDELVEQVGAFSRGHLISVTLTAYFAGQSTAD